MIRRHWCSIGRLSYQLRHGRGGSVYHAASFWAQDLRVLGPLVFWISSPQVFGPLQIFRPLGFLDPGLKTKTKWCDNFRYFLKSVIDKVVVFELIKAPKG